MPAVALIGMFDGVHLGHKALLEAARAISCSEGLRTFVFTFTSHPLATIRPEDAPPCLTPAPLKCNLLLQSGADEVRMQDFTPEFRALTAEEFLRILHSRYGVDVLLMGFNHRFGSDGCSDFDFYRRAGERAGVDVRLCSEKMEVDGLTVSSTAIRCALGAHDIALANGMLGRPYSIDGIVGHGREIGRTIGFPTANLQPSCPDQLIPPIGAYAAKATTADGAEYPAMLNIGCRPTIASSLPSTIEAHLIGYNADLYGSPLSISLLSYLRPERRFTSLEALRAQLSRDLAAVKQLF